MEKLISINELAKLLKASPATVNYYTNLGLFKIKDKKGNARLYDRSETLSIYDEVQRMRRDGYSLRLIKQKLEKGYNI